MKKYIYILEFKESKKTECYSSLASIYLHHHKKEIGISLPSLWNNKITVDNPYSNKIISITKKEVFSKPNVKNNEK